MGLGMLSPMLSSASAFPNTAVRETGLVIAGHGVGGVFSFTLSHSGARGEVLLSLSPRGVRSRQGRPGWHCIGKSGSFSLPKELWCSGARICCTCILPTLLFSSPPPSLGLTFADKLALISQNVILQLRAKSSQVLRLNSFSKPSLH